MDFCYALNSLRENQKVARHGWNDKNMFIYLVRDGDYASSTKVESEGEPVPCGPYIAMKTADEIAAPWTISQADLLAEDWAIV